MSSVWKGYPYDCPTNKILTLNKWVLPRQGHHSHVGRLSNSLFGISQMYGVSSIFWDTFLRISDILGFWWLVWRQPWYGINCSTNKKEKKKWNKMFELRSIVFFRSITYGFIFLFALFSVLEEVLPSHAIYCFWKNVWDITKR